MIVSRLSMTSVKTAFCFVAFAAASFSAGCTPNRRIMSEAAKTPEPFAASEKPALSSFETDVEAMRTADFNYIHVFRRRDGGVMTAEDKTVFSAYTPIETNRRKLSDGERAVILGSNYRFQPEMLKALSERFDVTDLSKPESEINKESGQDNSNANINFKTDQKADN